MGGKEEKLWSRVLEALSRTYRENVYQHVTLILAGAITCRTTTRYTERLPY